MMVFIVCTFEGDISMKTMGNPITKVFRKAGSVGNIFGAPLDFLSGKRKQYKRDLEMANMNRRLWSGQQKKEKGTF
ncbi:hypothetical protein QVD17_10251 [Tagetes erecta]|uniref:Uncharacterized protein n=1 Tax=Tagetes erecta TaxID=13708 RepID=A0AAD8L660_TARER|nr:hypothetical protein QVD17_10251 [Tagetes erecta]